MSDRTILVQMAKTLLGDIQDIQQRGAGYYTTTPFVQRYNKLAEKVQLIYADTGSQLLDTFTALEDAKSVDPMEKMKTTQRVIVEIGQLLAFMESVLDETAFQDVEESAADAQDSG